MDTNMAMREPISGRVFLRRWSSFLLLEIMALVLVWAAEIGVRRASWPVLAYGVLLITGWSVASYFIARAVIPLTLPGGGLPHLLVKYINLFLAGLALLTGIMTHQVPRSMIIVAALLMGMTLAHRRNAESYQAVPWMIRLEGVRMIGLLLPAYLTSAFFIVAPLILPA